MLCLTKVMAPDGFSNPAENGLKICISEHWASKILSPSSLKTHRLVEFKGLTGYKCKHIQVNGLQVDCKIKKCKNLCCPIFQLVQATYRDANITVNTQL